jgi:hypothetical protein
MLKKLIKFFVDDIKRDFAALSSILKQDGEYKFDTRIFNELKDPVGLLKSHWIVILVIILAFCSGWTVSAKHYQNECNELIMDIKDNCENYLSYKSIASEDFEFEELDIDFDEKEEIK